MPLHPFSTAAFADDRQLWKSFVGHVPRTEYQLTAAGRRALDQYLDHMESLIRRVREG